MSKKRLLKLRELEVVVMAHDVDGYGRLLEGFQMHIARVASAKGNILSMACNTEGDIKWSYPLHPYMMQTLPFCAECLSEMIINMEPVAKAVLTELLTPASNRGVNFSQ